MQPSRSHEGEKYLGKNEKWLFHEETVVLCSVQCQQTRKNIRASFRCNEGSKNVMTFDIYSAPLNSADSPSKQITHMYKIGAPNGKCQNIFGTLMTPKTLLNKKQAAANLKAEYVLHRKRNPNSVCRPKLDKKDFNNQEWLLKKWNKVFGKIRFSKF